MAAAVEAIGVEKRFGSVVAVEDLSLHVEACSRAVAFAVDKDVQSTQSTQR